MLHRPQHTIGADEVHLWHLLADEAMVLKRRDKLLPILNRQETERMSCFGQEHDRSLFLLSRVLMRSVLASYLQCDCRDLQFNTTSFGKPILHGDVGTLHFNLTHSRGAVALAVSGEREVGVDIEERCRQVDYLGLAERYFAADEARHLASLSEDQRAEAFFAIWTLKEAYVKGIGRGLTFPLDAFAFDLNVSRLIGFRPLAVFVAEDWQFHQFDLGARHCGAVAVEGNGAVIELRDWAAAFVAV
jgi:4'-phosphopantetheinyl transferase